MQSLAGYSSTIAAMLLAIGLKGLLKVDLRWYRNGIAEMRHSIVKGSFNNYVDNKTEVGVTHSRMGQYFFSYLLTLEVDLIEFLEVMAQIWQYVIFLSL